MKKSIILFVLCSMLVGMCIPVAQATDITYREIDIKIVQVFPDGSYVTEEITEVKTPTAPYATVQTVSGAKTQKLFSSDNELIASLTVHGTFEYGMTPAAAVNTSYSYTVDNSFWSFSGGKATLSGPNVAATGTFDYFLFVRSEMLSVTLTCTPAGTLF